MLSVSDPSLVVRLVASMPLKNRLVLVVRVPFTDGEMLPVPLIRTGGRSALTPASDDKRWVKLRGRRRHHCQFLGAEPPERRRRRRRQQLDAALHRDRLADRADLERHVQAPWNAGLDDDVGAHLAFERRKLERHGVVPGGSVVSVHSPWLLVTIVPSHAAFGLSCRYRHSGQYAASRVLHQARQRARRCALGGRRHRDRRQNSQHQPCKFHTRHFDTSARRSLEAACVGDATRL